MLFDPDAAGERAIERAAATAAELKLDLRVLRLPEDPADWLLGHPPEEFAGLLDGAVPVLEYGIRRIVERTRGTGATERSRAVPEVKSMIQEIKDPVLHREALRLATEALGVSPAVLEAAEPATPEPDFPRRPRRSDPHTEAGSVVLALVLARPDLATDALQQGIRVPALDETFSLRTDDFREETQARIFALLREHAGSDLGAVLSDERVRPLMDQIGALAARGEKLYPSAASIREAWLRLGILSRERAKRETSDYDRKDALQAEIQTLKETLRAVASRA